jgi:hypothetical protein
MATNIFSPDCNENPFLKKKIAMKSGKKLLKKHLRNFEDYTKSLLRSL